MYMALRQQSESLLLLLLQYKRWLLFVDTIAERIWSQLSGYVCKDSASYCCLWGPGFIQSILIVVKTLIISDTNQLTCATYFGFRWRLFDSLFKQMLIFMQRINSITQAWTTLSVTSTYLSCLVPDVTFWVGILMFWVCQAWWDSILASQHRSIASSEF